MSRPGHKKMEACIETIACVSESAIIRGLISSSREGDSSENSLPHGIIVCGEDLEIVSSKTVARRWRTSFVIHGIIQDSVGQEYNVQLIGKMGGLLGVLSSLTTSDDNIWASLSVY